MRKEIFANLFWLLLAIYISVESYRYGLGKWSMPGPGYFPFGAAVFLGCISLSLLVRALPKIPSKNEQMERAEKGRWQKTALILLPMLVYVALLKWIGFFLCTLLFFVYFLRLIATLRWFTTVILALSFAVVSYLLFNVALGAQIPDAFMKFLRGVAWIL